MWGGRNGLRVLGAQWWLRGSLTCRRRIFGTSRAVSRRASKCLIITHPRSSSDGTSSPEGHWMPTRPSFKRLAPMTSPEQDSGGGLVCGRR